MKRRNFLTGLLKTVAIAPIAAVSIEDAAKTHQEIHKEAKEIEFFNPFYERNPLEPELAECAKNHLDMNIDSNYPQFYMSWDDPDGIYIRKSTKEILKETEPNEKIKEQWGKAFLP